jgi:hypothetical protein
MILVHDYRDVRQTRCFCCFGLVSWARHCFGGPGSIFDAPWTVCMAIETSQKLRVLSFRSSFEGYRALFGVPGWFWMLHEPFARLSRHRKNMLFLSFRASFVGHTILGVPGWFFMLYEQGARLSRRSKNSLFLSFRASFVGYSALFWGPRTIFDAPWTMCTTIETSQKLIVFVISGQFPRL